MKKNRKILFAVAGLALVVTSIAGVGTFAWFQFQQNASADLNGTVIKTENNLMVGIYAPTLKDIVAQDVANGNILGYQQKMTDFKLVEDDTETGVYYVANEINTKVLNFVLEATGHAYDALNLVTTGDYNKGEAYSLMKRPAYRINENVNADAKDFVEFSLVFKALDVETHNPVAGTKLFFDNVSVTAKDKEQVEKAVRIGMKETLEGKGTVSQDIINVKATTSGSIRTSGRADLNADGVWDFLNGTKKEIYYGTQKSGEVNYKSEANNSGIIAGISDPGNNHFYEAESSDGVFEIDYTQNDLVDAKQNYNIVDAYSVSKIGDATNPSSPICVTNESGVGYVTFSLFMEGWDEASTNDISGQQFNAILNFSAPELNN